jgi:peptide/nickel transport system substrate-binding protein
MLTRREALQLIGLGGGAAFLAACAPSSGPVAGPSATAVPQPTAAVPSTPVVAQPTASVRTGGTLIWITDRDLSSFDMYQENSAPLLAQLAPAYSSLLRYDPLDVGKLLPDLAERWEISPDGLQYTFILRQGVRFHDGAPLTSADVKFSLDTLHAPKVPAMSIRRDWLTMVKSVEAPDPTRVVVALKYPAAELLPILGMVWTNIVPKHVAEAKGDMKKDIIGTGPFKFKAYQSGASLEYTKNEEYYDRTRPYLDGIKFLILKDQTTRLAALQTGKAHITALGGSGLTAQDAEQLEGTMKDKIKVWRHADLNVDSLTMNMSRKPWDDVRVRWAANLAFDRQAYARLVFGGAFTVGGFIPGGWGIPAAELSQMPGYRQPKDADRAEAKRLLAEAGYPEGFTTQMLVQSQAADQRRSEFAQDQLASIGIKVTFNIQESAAFFAKTTNRDYDIFMGAHGAQIVDPSPRLFQLFYTGGTQNFSLISDVTLDRQIDEQAREQTAAKRKEQVTAVERRLFELLPRISLGTPQSLTGMWLTVRNWAAHDGRFTFVSHRDTWLAE